MYTLEKDTENFIKIDFFRKEHEDYQERIRDYVMIQMGNIQENLTQQYQRLKIWEGALNRQLQNLKQATERLYKDSRYGLWQQQQKSQEHWHNFLNQCIEQQQDQNYELQAELDKLKEEWGRITSTNRL